MKPKRLAWPALLQRFYQAGQTIVLVVVVGALLLSKLNLAGREIRFGLLGLLVFAVGRLVLSGIQYWRWTYVVDSNGVTIRQGIFIRQVVHIPYDKIQTVRRQQWFYMRPFKLESLTIETAGKQDKKGEGQLTAVPLTVGDLIEKYRKGPVESPVPDKAKPVDQPDATLGYQINAHDLNVYALSSLGIVPIILVLGWVYDKGRKLLPEQRFNQAEQQLMALRGGLLIGLVLAVLLLGLLASYLNVLQRYYHFTLRREADQGLTMTRGYFQRNQVNVHPKRIQALRFKQNVIRQWLHLSTVQALTAGQAGEDEDDHSLVLMPVLKTSKAYEVLAPFIDWLPHQLPALRHVAAKRRWYFVRNSCLLWLAALTVIAGLIQWWLPQFLMGFLWSWPVWLMIAIFQGHYAGNSAAVGMVDAQLLVLQTGSLFTREQVIIPRTKVQSMTVSQTVWMRKAKLAHLNIRLRSGNQGKTIEVRYLDEATMRQIQAWYLPQDN